MLSNNCAFQKLTKTHPLHHSNRKGQMSAIKSVTMAGLICNNYDITANTKLSSSASIQPQAFYIAGNLLNPAS